jgi:hypothetical protein
LKEWTTPDIRNTPSTTNLEGEEIVDAPGKDGNASMPEQVKRTNPLKKKKMMMMILIFLKFSKRRFVWVFFNTVQYLVTNVF